MYWKLLGTATGIVVLPSGITHMGLVVRRVSVLDGRQSVRGDEAIGFTLPFQQLGKFYHTHERYGNVYRWNK